MKFLFDLFPVILFFIAFKLFGIYPATAVAMIATVLQIAWVRIRHGKVEPMQWVSLLIIGVFGGATILLHNETFIKWKPTVLYWLFAVTLVGSVIGWRKNLMRAMMEKQVTLPDADVGPPECRLGGLLRRHGPAEPLRGIHVLHGYLGQLQAVRQHGADAGVHRAAEHLDVAPYPEKPRPSKPDATLQGTRMAADPATIEALLRAALDPSRLTVRDDSAAHAGHAGAASGGGALRCADRQRVVCGPLAGCRHRMVYDALRACSRRRFMRWPSAPTPTKNINPAKLHATLPQLSDLIP